MVEQLKLPQSNCMVKQLKCNGRLILMNVARRGVKSTLPLHGMAHHVVSFSFKSIETDIFTLPNNGDKFTFPINVSLLFLNRQGESYKMNAVRIHQSNVINQYLKH